MTHGQQQQKGEMYTIPKSYFMWLETIVGKHVGFFSLRRTLADKNHTVRLMIIYGYLPLFGPKENQYSRGVHRIKTIVNGVFIPV